MAKKKHELSVCSKTLQNIYKMICILFFQHSHTNTSTQKEKEWKFHTNKISDAQAKTYPTYIKTKRLMILYVHN